MRLRNKTNAHNATSRKYELTSNKQRGGSQHMEINPVLLTAGQKFPPYTVGYLQIFKYLQTVIYVVHDFSRKP